MDLNKLCDKCKQLKPIADFKIKLSRARALSLGYTGNYAVITESKNCKECRPRPKPRGRKSNRELRAMVESGALNEFVYEKMVEKRKARATMKMSQAMTQRWENIEKAKWLVLKDSIQDEVMKVTNQYNCSPHSEVRMYANEYLKILTPLRATIKLRMSLAEKGAPLNWLDMVTATDIRKVRDTWEEIPIERRARMRVPLILKS